MKKKPYPRFTNCLPSSHLTSRTKKNNRSTGSTAERVLAVELKKLKLDLTTHPASIVGKPDFAVVRSRLAIFCDGDFWHGRNWRARRGSNSKYWCAKIQRNIRRDKDVSAELEARGWKVLRFWESDIIRSPAKVAEAIACIVRSRANRRQLL